MKIWTSCMFLLLCQRINCVINPTAPGRRGRRGGGSRGVGGGGEDELEAPILLVQHTV